MSTMLNGSLDGVFVGAKTSSQIYTAIFPGVTFKDAWSSVIEIPSGSSGEQHTALAGYVYNDDASPANGVALFGAGQATRDGTHVWGLNTLLMDAATRTAGSATGRILIGGEYDFNVMNPGTQVIGVSVGGNSLAQPTNAVGFIVNTLSQALGYKWTTGFFSMDGCATVGLAVGALSASGSNIDSQPILLQSFNASGVKKSVTIKAQNQSARISGNDADFTLNVDGWLAIPSSKGYAVGGQKVLGDRQPAIANASETTASNTATINALLAVARTHGFLAT